MAYERIIKEHDTFIIPIGQQAADEFKILSQASDYELSVSVIPVSNAGAIFLRLQGDVAGFESLLAQQGTLSWYILLQESTTVSDQIEIQLPQTWVYEGAVFTATAYYRTRDSKSAATPTNVYYRVDCLTTETQLADWTVIAVPATNNPITITAAMNDIQDDDNKTERKQITVQSDRGLSTQAVGRAMYTVENLYGSWYGSQKRQQTEDSTQRGNTDKYVDKSR